VLIAAGALLPASAGTFVKLGLADWLYLSELLGATIMFIGFLQATAHQPSHATAMQPAQSCFFAWPGFDARGQTRYTTRYNLTPVHKAAPDQYFVWGFSFAKDKREHEN
jgi:hypothetical protein